VRWLALVFVALIVGLQYPMWLGKGGWLQVRETDRQLAVQRDANQKLKSRNAALDADVRDLKTGSEAIEERARSELGMIRSDEVFFQLQQGAVMSGATARGAAKDGAAKAAPSKGVAAKRAATAAAAPSASGTPPKDAAAASPGGAADASAAGAAK